MIDDEDLRIARAMRRLKVFGLHLVIYFAVMIYIVVTNVGSEIGTPWFMVPLIGWGSVLALHTAYAMGLFGVFSQPKDE